MSLINALLHLSGHWKYFTYRFLCSLIITTALSALPAAVNAASPVVLWRTDLYGGFDDSAVGVAYDGLGSIYVSGQTFGSLGGPNQGSADGYVAKLDSTGQLKWLRQYGSKEDNRSGKISADSLGNVFVVGYVSGAFDVSFPGGSDAIVLKYDADGNLMWQKQLSTTGLDFALGVSADGSGSAYFTGRTTGQLGGAKFGSNDAYIGKTDTTGDIANLTQFGTSGSEWGKEIVIDAAGNAVVAGAAWGLFGPSDVQDFFVTKFDPAGNQVWLRSYGSEGLDQVNALSVDSFGNSYLVGVTDGQLGDADLESWDAFLCKVDPQGNLLWTKQFGTQLKDAGWGVATDTLGNVFVGCYTASPTTGTITHSMAFVTKFDADGNVKWTYNTAGTSFLDVATALTADGLGNVYVVGNTPVMAGFSNSRPFVMKLGEVPEPIAIILVAFGFVAASICQTRRRNS